MATKKVTKSKSIKSSSKAVKKVTKKSKPATKKAKSIKAVQALREGFKKPNKTNPVQYMRYQNVSIADASNERFPEMVQITNGPTKYVGLYGRKYVNPSFAMKAIDEYQAESLIGKGQSAVKKELMSVGINTALGGYTPFNKMYSETRIRQNDYARDRMTQQYYTND